LPFVGAKGMRQLCMHAPSAGLSLKSCSCSLTYNLAWTCRMGERIQWCVTAQSCPSPDQLPPKYQQKLDKLNRVFHKYPVRHLGSATYSVEYVRETDGVTTSHTVKLELDRETNVPRWRALCTCGRPWTRRQPRLRRIHSSQGTMQWGRRIEVHTQQRWLH
jgi:hypothetical protein